jgi:hypothetical protein
MTRLLRTSGCASSTSGNSATHPPGYAGWQQQNSLTS